MIKSEPRHYSRGVLPQINTSAYGTYVQPSPISAVSTFSRRTSATVPSQPHPPTTTSALNDAPLSQPPIPTPLPAVEDTIPEDPLDFDWDDLANLDEGRLEDLEDNPVVALVPDASNASNSAPFVEPPWPENDMFDIGLSAKELVQPELEDHVQNPIDVTHALTEVTSSVSHPTSFPLEGSPGSNENLAPVAGSSLAGDGEPSRELAALQEQSSSAPEAPEPQLANVGPSNASNEEHEVDAMVSLRSEPMSAIDLPPEIDGVGSSSEPNTAPLPAIDESSRSEDDHLGASKNLDARRNLTIPSMLSPPSRDTVQSAPSEQAMDVENENALRPRQDEDMQTTSLEPKLQPITAIAAAPLSNPQEMQQPPEQPPSVDVAGEQLISAGDSASNMPEGNSVPAGSTMISPPTRPERGASPGETSEPPVVSSIEPSNAEPSVDAAMPLADVTNTDISHTSASVPVPLVEVSVS